MKIISVGSKNPIKIKAVENVVKKLWPEMNILSWDAPSLVSEQPVTDEEAILGATNRAKFALRESGADMAVGLEGCTIDTKYGMFVSHWVVVMDKNGNTGIGAGGKVLLPEKVALEIRKGRELGPVMDDFIGEKNTKQKQGAAGILTGGLIKRTDALEKTLIYALSKFINPHYYK